LLKLFKVVKVFRDAVNHTLYCLGTPLKPFRTATPDTTKLSRLCRVRFGVVNWIPDNSRLSQTENLKSEHVNSNRPIHTAKPDTTRTGLSEEYIVVCVKYILTLNDL